MNIFRKITNQKGQTLLEVMVALSIASLIVSAIVVSIINALNNEQFGVNQNQATQLAQEGVDLFRNLSQSDWSSFVGYGNSDGTPRSWCLPQVNPTPAVKPAGGCSRNAGNNNIFIREVKIELNSCITPTPGITNISGRITSTVKWADGKCIGTGDTQYCHQTQVVSCMFRPYINSTF